MTNAGYFAVQTLAASMFVFTGTGQLAIAELTAAGSLSVVIVFTALVVSLRVTMYSASLAPYLEHLPMGNRLVLTVFLVDQPCALSILKFSSDESVDRFWYYLGAALPLWGTWQVATVSGIVFGASIPQWIDVGFIIPLIFIAILVPALEDVTSVVAAIAAGFLAFAADGLPFELELLAGALGGIVAGVLAEYGVER